MCCIVDVCVCVCVSELMHCNFFVFILGVYSKRNQIRCLKKRTKQVSELQWATYFSFSRLLLAVTTVRKCTCVHASPWDIGGVFFSFYFIPASKVEDEIYRYFFGKLTKKKKEIRRIDVQKKIWFSFQEKILRF